MRVALVVAAAGLALWLGVQGGEYSTADLIRQARERRRVVAAIDSLTRVVDSLRAYRQKVLNDPRTQERIAREEFGMVRGRELLYRFADPPDSTASRARP